MQPELSEEQQTVLRLCCEAASAEDLPYWEVWFSPSSVLTSSSTLFNVPEKTLAPTVQSLVSQGYLLVPPAEERPEQAMLGEGSLPDSCQVAGLGFEKYAEATTADYLELVEEVSRRVSTAEPVSHKVIAEQLGARPEIVAHIIHYHELL